MNRRSFLQLFTATAAAAVAGLRPRLEPAEVVTRLGRGSRDTLDNFGIPAEDVKLAVHKWRETNAGVDVEGDEITLADDGLTGIASPAGRIVFDAGEPSWASLEVA